MYALLQAATSSITGCISCLSLSANLPPCLTACPAALSAADRGGFKTVRQLMDPVIEEMQEAAAGEDDGMLIKAVGVLHKVFGPTSGWSAWPASWRVCLADKRVCVLGGPVGVRAWPTRVTGLQVLRRCPQTRLGGAAGSARLLEGLLCLAVQEECRVAC